jgi:hypothetical protein
MCWRFLQFSAILNSIPDTFSPFSMSVSNHYTARVTF